MKAEDFDRAFDAGESIMDCLDLSASRRPGYELKRLPLELPAWMVDSLDRESRRLGVPRQSLIKMLIARHLDKEAV